MLAPKLRFKEFDGDWVKKNISEIADVKGGKRLPKGFSLQTESNGFPYITVTDMENTTVNIKKIKYVPLDAVEKIKRYRIFSNEIYISVAGTLGLIGIIPQELDGANLTENADKLTNIKCNQHYFLHYLNNGSLSNLIDSVSTVGAQPKLALYAIQKMTIFIPNVEEQTKIASFLSTVDEKISQLTQKHVLLSQYKQGMMQKLFSQQIRFKADDGSEFGEWKKAKIGNITETIFGYPFDSKEMVEDTKGIPLMRGINIGERHIRHSFELDRYFLNDYSRLKKYFVKTKDIVLSMDGSKVGRNSALVTERDTSSLLVQRVCILRENQMANILYIYQWIISNQFHRYVDQVKTSSGIPHISGKQIQDFEIPSPCLEEQTKIANFLSTIDQKIEVVSNQIEQAKIWKKGLLQQMFV